jgi:hypothetical protein
MDLFGNREPSVHFGSLTSLAFFRAKTLQKCFFSGSCSETEVSKQLFLIIIIFSLL